jgi:hypothetical protein
MEGVPLDFTSRDDRQHGTTARVNQGHRTEHWRLMPWRLRNIPEVP